MTYADNRRARHEYQILETYEGGLVLTGREVKAIREGGMKLSGAYVRITPSAQTQLIGAHIAPYSKSGAVSEYDPNRSRIVLLHVKERRNLATKTLIRGLTLIPLSVYPSGRRIKLSFALCKGKQLHDKRAAIKEREWKRRQSRG